ncbi:MAG: metalloregulator ArsR/SmtB family transcription factor [Candidatus Aenigmarchaeota archaeon]|nr:metalloregulator ArsR/SmtB family transcription factor [Candidatus Aenigmarchaeota archaeon]
MLEKTFGALSNPVRMKIVEVIGKSEICACMIPRKVGRAQPTVSQHLKLLEDVGILSSRRDGKKILYSIKSGAVFDLIESAKRIG